ncbi:calcium-activated potassium channel subunit beta-3 [Cololabis saira]|uniref:calcium-activated potassium channel subunit beta-3 n=1 Tax=Cololabis saira TaxID=129043 RepID=UPI002AD3F5DB|nr:calcium-activated potassium channel subunit beta-3 [Cololabis saira]
MFLNATSPRRSFSIPININLQGSRGRPTREPFCTAAGQDHDRSRRGDGRGGPAMRTQRLVSSVGEDRAVLLGFTMMAFSVLMFFVVGINTVKPYVNSSWQEVSCVLLQTHILEEWVDCRGVSTAPCLRATVNLNHSSWGVLLHFDEESVLLGTECFYIPKCQMDRKRLQEEVQKVRSSLESQLGANSTCLSDGGGRAIVQQTYTLGGVLLGLLWPCLMLGGGALIVGLVKLTQDMAHLSPEPGGHAAGPTATCAHGKLYRLLRRSSANSPP